MPGTRGLCEREVDEVAELRVRGVGRRMGSAWRPFLLEVLAMEIWGRGVPLSSGVRGGGDAGASAPSPHTFPHEGRLFEGSGVVAKLRGSGRRVLRPGS